MQGHSMGIMADKGASRRKVRMTGWFGILRSMGSGDRVVRGDDGRRDVIGDTERI